MNNKGRTYLFTLLVLASAVVLFTAIGFTSAGKPQPVCGNNICERGELTSCPSDCEVHSQSIASACHIAWSSVNEVTLNSVGGVTTDIASCKIGALGACEGYTISQTSCAGLQNDGSFLFFLQNRCGCDEYGSCAGSNINVIDHTGCGFGNHGCGFDSSGQGKGTPCLNSVNKVVSGKHNVGGTLHDFWENGTVVANSCMVKYTASGGHVAADKSSLNGQCAIAAADALVH